MEKHFNVFVVLYDNFTALDAIGPAEVLGRVSNSVRFVSLKGGTIENRQGVRILTETFDRIEKGSILLIPGGTGSRTVIKDGDFIRELGKAIEDSEYTLCVCTGSALAAETGLMDGKKATSNKSAWGWVTDNHPNVLWDKMARWVADGKFYTSAGVSAGIDMALGFVNDRLGPEAAEEICRRLEYHWNSDPDHDSFGME